ncbi:MAG TPA: sugar phosphate isomerase/epimerase [Bacillota bacterium]|jgi:sugar phosphate isomerase/epimerase|nr:sugar phosphate isomerase/epimerase [Clostridiaceae bacterium]HPY63984.1 sugar phosphate isomerase/epimerase [Bacillota bacterium]HQC49107.1 sugar phosphate isomerase/epimerase [Bacillota bacterium]
MFKIGTLADWFGLGLLEGIRESSRCGATGVQIYAAGEFDPRTTATDSVVKEVISVARASGQTITALCGELGGYGLEKAEDNAAKIDYLKQVLILADRLDCRIVTTHVGVVPKDRSHPRYEVMLNAMGELAYFANRLGSYVAVETGPESMTVLRAFVDECGPGAAINYDPANLVMVGADDEVEGVRIAGSAIVHTHAKDGRSLKQIDPEDFYHQFAEGGLEWAAQSGCSEETPLGEGSVRWMPYLRALQEIGYNGYLTIEREVVNGSEDIRMAVQFLKECIEQL